MELGGPAVLFAWDCPGGNVEIPGAGKPHATGGVGPRDRETRGHFVTGVERRG